MKNPNRQPLDITRLKHCQARIAAVLEACLPNRATLQLHQAMRHSSLNGGKRLRPLLVYLAAELYNVAWEQVDRVAAAMELVHCYSLVHDDLPAMDNDDFRRGLPTTHRLFGEATAILAGDGLLTLAFELLSQPAPTQALAAHTCLDLIKTLSKAAGATQGMLLGQALDLSGEGSALSIAEITEMHRAKTGALIAASVQCGALATERASEAELAALHDYGHALGMAFQIHDDILDCTGEIDTLGKQAGQDLKQQKSTFVTQQNITQARADAQTYAQTAYQALRIFDHKADQLRALCQFTIERAA